MSAIQLKHHKDLHKIIATMFLVLSFVYGYFSYFTLDIVLVYRDFGINLIAPIIISLFSAVSLLVSLKLYVFEKNIWKACVQTLIVFPLVSLGLSSLLLSQYDYNFESLTDGYVDPSILFPAIVVMMFTLSFTTFGLMTITRKVFTK